MAEKFSCPNCGAELGIKFSASKFVVCEFCQSCLFLEDEAVRNAGKMSVLTEFPSIFCLGGQFSYRNWSFVPIGRVRYDYGRGWWDEWYVADNKGEFKWITVDEGDIAIEQKAEFEGRIPEFDQTNIGDTVSLKLQGLELKFQVTEKNSCTCIGAEGELPFPITPFETYYYLDLSGPNKRIFTIEYTEDGTECYEGLWIDPFEIKGDIPE